MAHAQVITHPAFAQGRARQQHAAQARAQNRGQGQRGASRHVQLPALSRMRTRDLKFSIEALALMLTLPESHPMAYVSGSKSYQVAAERLDRYLTELENRDRRDDERTQQPLADARLSQRVNRELAGKFRLKVAA